MLRVEKAPTEAASANKRSTMSAKFNNQAYLGEPLSFTQMATIERPFLYRSLSPIQNLKLRIILKKVTITLIKSHVRFWFGVTLTFFLFSSSFFQSQDLNEGQYNCEAGWQQKVGIS
jgi:hypothetical protein